MSDSGIEWPSERSTRDERIARLEDERNQWKYLAELSKESHQKALAENAQLKAQLEARKAV